MAEFYEVVNKIIENDLNDEPSEQEEVAEEREAQDKDLSNLHGTTLLF